MFPTGRPLSRLGFMKWASRYLDTQGRLPTYCGFVPPIMEYAPTVWMGAAPTHLAQLDRIQRRALHILGPHVLLQSLAAKRMVSATAYMYKLLSVNGPLSNLTPPPLNPPPVLRTRAQHLPPSPPPPTHPPHQHQLCNLLQASSTNIFRRSFPMQPSRNETGCHNGFSRLLPSAKLPKGSSHHHFYAYPYFYRAAP